MWHRWSGYRYAAVPSYLQSSAAYRQACCLHGTSPCSYLPVHAIVENPSSILSYTGTRYSSKSHHRAFSLHTTNNERRPTSSPSPQRTVHGTHLQWVREDGGGDVTEVLTLAGADSKLHNSSPDCVAVSSFLARTNLTFYFSAGSSLV